jgi:hypothetical protein
MSRISIDLILFSFVLPSVVKERNKKYVAPPWPEPCDGDIKEAIPGYLSDKGILFW